MAKNNKTDLAAAAAARKAALMQQTGIEDDVATLGFITETEEQHYQRVQKAAREAEKDVKTRRVSLVLSQRVYDQIKRAADEDGLSLNAFITESVKSQIGLESSTDQQLKSMREEIEELHKKIADIEEKLCNMSTC